MIPDLFHAPVPPPAPVADIEPDGNGTAFAELLALAVPTPVKPNPDELPAPPVQRTVAPGEGAADPPPAPAAPVAPPAVDTRQDGYRQGAAPAHGPAVPAVAAPPPEGVPLPEPPIALRHRPIHPPGGPAPAGPGTPDLALRERLTVHARPQVQVAPGDPAPAATPALGPPAGRPFPTPPTAATNELPAGIPGAPRPAAAEPAAPVRRARPAPAVRPAGDQPPPLPGPPLAPASAPAAPAGGSPPAAPDVERVVRVVEEQARLAPPRSVVVDLDGDHGRIAVSLRGAEVHLAWEGANAALPEVRVFQRAVVAALLGRGFDVAGDGPHGRGHREPPDPRRSPPPAPRPRRRETGLML